MSTNTSTSGPGRSGAARPLRRILVPSDFSPSSEKACIVANRLAEAFDGTVDLLHVIPTLTYFRESIKTLGVPFDMERDVYPRIQKESQHRLKTVMADYIHERNHGRIHVAIDRRASDGIVGYADEHGYDLIVIGARGLDETALLRGSTSERVIRRSRTPVFTIGDTFEWAAVKRLLVPTDGSDDSLDALDVAWDLSRALGGLIRLLYVMQLYDGEDAAGALGRRSAGLDQEDAVRDAIREKIASRYPEASQAGSADGWLLRNGRDVPLELAIIRGVSAHYEIEREAESWADLVVMATHGHSGLAHLVLGSTAEKVAAAARKPVLTIRPASLD